MRKRIFLSFIFLVAAFTALTYFTNPASVPVVKKTQPVADTSVAITESEPDQEQVVILPANDTLTDIAHFIAGIKSFKTNYLQELARDSSWYKYALNIEKTWKKLDTVRYNQMENWAQAQLGSLSSEHNNLFYPFSGPDFLNADLFFPMADTITMFGLEPVGTLPPVDEEWFKDSVSNYVNSLRQSLTNVLHLSFFITKNMFRDLRANELNGTTHLLLWFAARRKYAIAAVTPLALNYAGNAITGRDTAYASSKIKGVEIVCVKDGHNKVVRYFSADISNYGFKKNPRMEKFVTRQHFSSTLVKSASYLMHSSNFSVVRNLIMNKCDRFLQDDTGIPYKYFANKNWEVTLYGEYERPIRIFDHNYQDDLRRAYDSLEVKPLPFGIGYKYRQNESTWILARKARTLAKVSG